MHKAEIHRLALLGAAKITLLVGGAGCHAEAAPTAKSPNRTITTLSRSSVEVAAPTNAGVVLASATTEPSEQCGDSSAPPAKESCDDILRRATADRSSVPSDVAWKCCDEPGMREKYSYCTPWGPPAPPRLRARMAARGLA
ncbi:MAG: hypothetical protein U0271_17235 [Polyangiaceae bacterium]